jgi:predicted GNAT superfamily acetyltransferase
MPGSCPGWSRSGWSISVQEAFLARRIGYLDAFLLAFDQDARYDSPNFLWFRSRYPRFVYVDRIAVAASARGRGCARRLYHDLFEHTRRAGHARIVCEVNSTPANPESDAFHAALGFVRVGRRLDTPLIQIAPRGKSLHVDLEAKVDFGGWHTAAKTPIFRRGFDQGDLDIERWNTERCQIADQGLVERPLGVHRTPGKHRDFNERKLLPTAGRNRKMRSRMLDQAQRSVALGNFQRLPKRRLDRLDHGRRVGDPAGSRGDQGIWHPRP